jgi:hypothetical protein
VAGHGPALTLAAACSGVCAAAFSVFFLLFPLFFHISPPIRPYGLAIADGWAFFVFLAHRSHPMPHRHTPSHPHRKIFLSVLAALPALAALGALTLPGTVMAQTVGSVAGVTIINGGADISSDALTTPTSTALGTVIIPSDGASPIASGNEVTVDQNFVTGGVINIVGGGSFSGGNVSNNTVTITDTTLGSGPTVNGVVAGGAGLNANVTGNTVTVEYGTVAGGVNGGLAISTGTDISVSGNKVFLGAGATVGSGVSYGGLLINDAASTSGSVTNNEMRVNGATISHSVIGGGADGFGVVDNNTVLVENATITAGGVTGGAVTASISGKINQANNNTVTLTNSGAKSVHGGLVLVSNNNIEGQANENKVTLTNDGTNITINDNVFGGTVEYSGIYTGLTGTANRNTVEIGGNYTIDESIFGGRVEGDGDANDNRVTLSSVTVDKEVHGAHVDGNGNANGNIVTLNDKTQVTGFVYGAFMTGNDGDATNNSVILNGETQVARSVYGALVTGNGNATGNSVTLNDKTQVTQSVYGAFVAGYSGVGVGTGDATGNSVTLDGNASVSGGVIYGAFVDGNGDAIHNTINIGANVTLANNVNLAGGYVVGTGDAFTGNTLNTQGWTGSVGSVNNFATYNLQVPNNLAAGAPIVTLTNGNSDFEGSTVNLTTSSGAPLAAGSTVVSFEATGGGTITGTLANSGVGQGQYGIALIYNTKTVNTGSQIVTTTTNVRAHPQTQSFSEGFLSGVAFVNHAADLAVGQGLSSLLAQTANKSGVQGFAATSYGDSRYETGSHIDVKGYNFLAGLGSSSKLNAGRLNLGGFVETGKGDYDTHNNFSGYANVKGDGDTRYTGVGLLGRLELENGVYVEASLRSGRLKNDFSNGLADGNGNRVHAKFDTKSTYVSTHAGVGYVWALQQDTSAEVYGKYLWTHQGGDSVRLNTGDPVKFSAVDSQRLRLGGRVTWKLSGQTDLFVGAAYEHEFDGDAKAKIYGYRISAPSLEGDSGIGEIGVTMRPSANSPLSLQAVLQGYGGDRRGATGSFNLKYGF